MKPVLIRRPLLTTEFLSQPLPACYVQRTYDDQSSVNWRSLQNLLDLTVLPNNWSWKDIHSYVQASAHGVNRKSEPTLSVAVACTGQLTIQTAIGPIIRTGTASSTATRTVANENGLAAYDGALISASRTAFKRACYLLGRVFGQDLGDKNCSVDQLLKDGNRTLDLPIYVPVHAPVPRPQTEKTPHPGQARTAASETVVRRPQPDPKPLPGNPPANANPSPEHAHHAEPRPVTPTLSTGTGPAASSETLTSPEEIRHSWSRSLEESAHLPAHQRYPAEIEIEREHEQLLRQAGDPAPHRRLHA